MSASISDKSAMVSHSASLLALCTGRPATCETPCEQVYINDPEDDRNRSLVPYKLFYHQNKECHMHSQMPVVGGLVPVM
jgi:hypothetical protein